MQLLFGGKVLLDFVELVELAIHPILIVLGVSVTDLLQLVLKLWEDHCLLLRLDSLVDNHILRWLWLSAGVLLNWRRLNVLMRGHGASLNASFRRLGPLLWLHHLNLLFLGSWRLGILLDRLDSIP